jgi:hypothetical protein
MLFLRRLVDSMTPDYAGEVSDAPNYCRMSEWKSAAREVTLATNDRRDTVILSGNTA